jgi:hypothetical protein
MAANDKYFDGLGLGVCLIHNCRLPSKYFAAPACVHLSEWDDYLKVVSKVLNSFDEPTKVPLHINILEPFVE